MFDEGLGQLFRLADEHHVTGIHLDERLHTTERVNVLVLHLPPPLMISQFQRIKAGRPFHDPTGISLVSLDLVVRRFTDFAAGGDSAPTPSPSGAPPAG